MFNKKLSLFAMAMMTLGLASCGGGGGGKADLTYWCPSGDNDVMSDLVTLFKNSNSEYANLKIECGANYGEGDTYAQLHKDLDAAADVILMADNNIRSGVNAEELVEIKDDEFKRTVSEGAIAATSLNGKMYGYAYRADNSPMPIYDTSVFTAEQVKDFPTILRVAKEKGKKVYFDMGNGWYNPTMLWSGGGDFTIGADGKLVTNVGGKGSAKQGVAACLQAMKDLYNEYQDTWVSSSDNGKIEAGFGDGTIAYAFLWNDMATIQTKNDKVSVAIWPNLKIGNGVVPMECFSSYKAIVCKEGTDANRVALAKAFAKFLASKRAQEIRLEKLSYGPANLELLASDKVKSLPFIAAIGEMENLGRTHGQAISTTDDFWDPMGNLGGLVINGKTTWGDYDSAARALDALVSNKGWSVGEL